MLWPVENIPLSHLACTCRLPCPTQHVSFCTAAVVYRRSMSPLLLSYHVRPVR